ncbi:uncharacterized protein C8A04DRAFT_28396 [Dichotomopilus funicola]|uniref:Uncharacterized protein n=1 Tax=Dichotomopilus funicola TaxID=1934379 RepID=A0AAN6V328_9PEZI|nr:hypothetical protein C8A04DRAFT_28396 [Dichotomopilus funicola]
MRIKPHHHYHNHNHHLPHHTQNHRPHNRFHNPPYSRYTPPSPPHKPPQPLSHPKIILLTFFIVLSVAFFLLAVYVSFRRRRLSEAAARVRRRERREAVRAWRANGGVKKVDEEDGGVENAGEKVSLLVGGDDTGEGLVVGSKGVADYSDTGTGEMRVRRWTATWADKVGKRAAVVSGGMKGWRLAPSKDLEAQCVKGGIY